MSLDQAIVFATLGGALVCFAWGRWRYDLVAVLALLAVVLGGVVPVEREGFAHPAVVTVAAVLVVSRALQNAGVVDLLIGLIAPLKGRANLQLGAQTGLTAVLSGAMNNVGAVALLLPVALRNAYRDGYSPAKTLMPLAFGSLLGGLVTLIGTPPNIIVSTIRAGAVGRPYTMFDFTPVGGAVALTGLLFLVTVGWRLIPKERLADSAGPHAFDIGDYLLEARVSEGSRAMGMTLEELERVHDDARVVRIVHDSAVRLIPATAERVALGDVLLLQGEPDALKELIGKAGLELMPSEKLGREDVRSEDVEVVEAIVKPGSRLAGRTPAWARLRSIYSVNLLGIARHGHRARARLKDVRFQVGDVLLLQGTRASLDQAMSELGGIPLAERSLGLGRPRRLIVALLTFIGAIAAAVAGVLPIHVAFLTAVALLVLFQVLRLDEVYGAIDWPVIVLLGAMLPVGGALEATGGTALVAQAIIALSGGLPAVWVLILLLVVTMMLSDVINNNATAVLMAPLALTLADGLGVSPDPFLMAVAIGASCAFLTPIGHQSNTLVLAPGGYRFGGYWRVGLPLEVVIVAVAVPVLLVVWPL